jgi:hypothetical protein
VRPRPPACVEVERRAQSYDDCTAVTPETRDALVQVRKMIEQQLKDDPNGVAASCQAALEVMSQLPTCP